MAASNAEDTYALVCDVWRSAIPTATFDPGLSLSDSGADSLKVMGMVLRLEMALGRSVPLDLLHPDTSARSLADGLSTGNEAAAVEGRPRCFVLPGIGGDQLMLAAIRRALDAQFQLDLIRQLNHMDGGREEAGSAGAGITCILPMPQVVYTGDEDGNVVCLSVMLLCVAANNVQFEWNCVKNP